LPPSSRSERSTPFAGERSGEGKNTKLVCVVIAHELAGFLWDIVREEIPLLTPAHTSATSA
jgi:hypothetical protein